MASSARRRLAALSEQLVAPIADQGTFEDIPRLKKIALDSNGPRVKGKVVIVTGQYVVYLCALCRLIRPQEQIHLLALDVHQLINLRRMAQELYTYATTTILIWPLISVSWRHCILVWMYISESLMLQMKSQ